LIQNLVDQIAFVESKTDQNLSNSIGFTNDLVQALETNLGTRLEEISRRLDDVTQRQRNIVDRVGGLGEHGNILERRLLELNDKVEQSMRELSNCTATAAKSLETSVQSFTAARELQTESMRASKTVQQTTQEALASLNERIDKQDSEIRSLHSKRLEGIGRRLDDVALQQRNVLDRVGKLDERGDIHERGLLELNDKVKQSMREPSDCTAIAKRSLETSAQSLTATRELQT